MSTYTLNCNCKLTEDYIHTQDILASSTASQPLATFLNSQNQSEALVVHDDGELCHLLREPLSSSGWNIVGIGAQVATIGAADSGTVWIIDNDQNIWMSNTGHWNLIQNLPGGNQQISVLNDGTIYGTAQQGDQSVLYAYDPDSASFVEQQLVPYSAPPVGSTGNLWSIDDNGAIVTSAGLEGWTEFQNQPDGTPQEIFVTPDQTVYVVCDGGTLFTLSSDGFDWPQLAVPDGMFGFAPVNANQFYALAKDQSGTITLYSCDGKGNNTAVAQPTGRPLDGISVGLDGTLWGLDVIGTVWRSANGTWIRQIQPTDLSGTTGGLQVTEVVTGRHAMGNQYAFYVIAGDLYWSMFEEQEGVFGGYWTEKAQVQLPNGISNIGVVNDPVTASNLIVYGVSSNGNFVVVQTKGDNNWTGVEHSMKTSLTGTEPIFNTYNSNWVTYAIIENTLHVGAGSLDSPAGTLSPISNSPQLSTFIPFSTNPRGIDTVLLAAVDTQNQVWTITIVNSSFKSYVFTQLSGPAVDSALGSVQSAVAMIDQQTVGARIYARDENNMLWIIRQTSSQPELPAVFGWSEWHPLGNECMVLGTGCTMLGTNDPNAPPVDLFSLDAGYEVNVLSEDATTGALTDLVMLKPAGTNVDAEYVTRYLNEITIVDEYSNPAANVALSVAADQAVGIWVVDALYNVTPTIPVQLTTDQKGQITFAFFAADIHSPTFSFAANGLVNPPSLYPAQDVNDYLSGSATAFPDRPVFDEGGQALLGAQMQSQPAWAANPTPFVQSQDAPNAGAAASSIRQVYTIPTNSSGTSGTWSVASSTTTGVGSSHFWNDLCNFPHDIDHAIKKAALKISKVAVDVENKLVTLTMELASGLSQALQLVIHTVEDVISAVKSVFRYIERGIEDAIHWLKALFSWHDIINTKNVLEAAFLGLIGRMEGNLNDPTSPNYAGTLFNTYFDEDVKNKIKAAFNNVSSIFAPGTSMQTTTNNVASPLPPNAQPMGPDALHPSNVSDSQSSNGTHTNYVHNHVTNYSNNGGKLPPSAMGDGSSGDGILQTLFDAITNNLVNNGDFQPMKTAGSLQSLFDPPSNFANLAMYDIVTAIEDAVLAILDVVEGVVDALIELAGNALAGFKKVLTAKIDIPIISWLYEKISGHPLTILDLLCLVAAVPVTIVYKLTFGIKDASAPFTDESAQALVDEYTSSFPWPAIAGGSTIAAAMVASAGTARAGAAAAPALVGSFPFPSAGALMVLNTSCYAIFDAFNDLWTYGAAKDPDAPADPITTFFSWSSIVTTMFSQWLTAPYNIFPGQSTTAEKMTISLWSLNFIPVFSGLVFTLASGKKALAEFNNSYGMPLTCATGVLLFAMGIATSVEQSNDPTKAYGPLYWVQNGIAAVPTVMKPLAIVTEVAGEPAGAVAAGILIGTDAVLDMANGALAVVEDAI